jgi:hypothetical protein
LIGNFHSSFHHNYLCNQCLSPLKLWDRTLFMARCTRYNNMWSSLSVTCDRSVVACLPRMQWIVGFDPWSNQTKGNTIGICCFSTKHPVFRSKNKDWLAWNRDNVSEWASTIKIQLIVVWYKADIIIISLNITCFIVFMLRMVCFVVLYRYWDGYQYFILWVGDCCLTTNQHFFQLYYGENKLYSMKWWWCPLCTRPQLIGSLLC